MSDYWDKVDPKEMRLNRFIAQCGVAARRKADEYIARGLVTVNGQVVSTMGVKVLPHKDIVCFKQQILQLPKDRVYFLVHKPVGVVSSVSDPDGKPVVVDMVDTSWRIFPVGRLDEDSEGLMLLTNDGLFAHRMMHPAHEVLKTYRVKVQGKFPKAELITLTNGIVIKDLLMQAREARILSQDANTTWLEIQLAQGKNRQIRRMLGGMGYEVLQLIRTNIGPFTLEQLGGKPYIQVKSSFIASLGI